MRVEKNVPARGKCQVLAKSESLGQGTQTIVLGLVSQRPQVAVVGVYVPRTQIVQNDGEQFGVPIDENVTLLVLD
jgi:hypothetical protein